MPDEIDLMTPNLHAILAAQVCTAADNITLTREFGGLDGKGDVEIEVRAGGRTYYNTVTAAQMDTHGQDAAIRTCTAALWGMLVADGHAHAVRCEDAVEARQLDAALGYMRAADGLRDILKRPHRITADARAGFDLQGPPVAGAVAVLDPASERVIRDMMVAEALGLLMVQLGNATDAARRNRTGAQLHADLVQLAGTALALAAGIEARHG